jgi:serine/threonine protein kinase
MSDSESEADILLQLAQEFADRCRRGERPSLTEYTQKNPELAVEIRDLFPAMLLMEEFGSVGGSAASPRFGALTKDGVVPSRLGEYRILREVARGGMGIVYEAVQESLGRHVAIKVLPFQRLLHANYLERFRREARAAARLHHSNIVPVFGVGEHEGFHYYAMQFIQGQALDHVLHELRRLRRPTPGYLRESNEPSKSDPLVNGVSELNVSLAGGLMTGHFSPKDDEQVERRPVNPTHQPSAAEPGESSRKNSSAVTLSGHSQLGAQSDVPYFRSVAQIGIQVAEALAYAHQQNILHRDIKPSNLLLDTQGVIWVTDFGLAKAEGTDELTSPNDLVGTLRYMAPERFQGLADPRSDVFSLGLTLYEMATLQPAFAESERARQIDKILHKEPSLPRKVDGQVPRDLETIILKTIAKDPDRRYQTAGQLAEDLRRFLADRPIQARRSTVWERSWRWCRRNPIQAAMSGFVTLLLLILASGLLINILLRQERDNAIQAEKTANDLLERAQIAEKDVQILSHLARASAYRRSRQKGQRFAALDEVTQAVRFNPSSQLRRELRSEAIACLALPDLRTAHEWEGWPADSAQIDFDEKLETYARVDRQGNISVCRVADPGKIIRLPGLGTSEAWPHLSRDGRFLAVWGTGDLLKVWDLSDPTARPFEESNCTAPDFSFDSRLIAYGCRDGSVKVTTLGSGQLHRQVKVGCFAQHLAFSPVDCRLAVCGNISLRIFDVETEYKVDLPHPGPFEYAAWHPDGNHLAVVCQQERRIQIWDVASQRQTAKLEGYTNGGIRLAFDPSGEILASTGWEGLLRFWEPRTGKQLFQTHASMPCLRFGGKGSWIAAETDHTKLRLSAVASGHEYRTLRHLSAPNDGVAEYYGGSVDPHGRLLAMAMRDGVRIWDFASGDEIAFLPLDATGGVCFQASGALLTNGAAGIYEWPIHFDLASQSVVVIGPPSKLSLPGFFSAIACSADGKTIARGNGDGAAVFHRGQLQRITRLEPQQDVRGVAISADGRWIATGSFKDPGAKVWDAETGDLVKELPVGNMCHVAFSRNWLATGGGGCRLWKVGTWEEGPVIGGLQYSTFSPDGKLLATDTGSGAVRLVDPETGEEIARFEDPNQDRAGWIGFTPDGTRLLTASSDSGSIHVWDLRNIRHELATLDLDWQPASQEPGPINQARQPVRMQVDLGGLTGDAFAAKGQWDKAASEYEQALQRSPEEWSLTYRQLLIRLALGDRAGYRRDCAQALERFGKSGDSETATWIAWACALWPESGRDMAPLIALARKARAADPKSYVYARTLGATLLRAGRLEEAIQCLDEALKLQQESPMTWLLLARAHQRSAHPEEARRWLDKACRWIDALAPARTDYALGDRNTISWTERLGLRHLRGEAEVALKEPPAGPPLP